MKNICKVCGKEFESKRERPFCSKRCWTKNYYQKRVREGTANQRLPKTNYACNGLKAQDIPIKVCLNCQGPECKYDNQSELQ